MAFFLARRRCHRRNRGCGFEQVAGDGGRRVGIGSEEQRAGVAHRGTRRCGTRHLGRCRFRFRGRRSFIVALLVYDHVGVSVLKKAWINLDWVWAGAFVLAGVLTLFT